MNDPLAEYARRLALWNERIAQHDRRHLAISNCRLAVAFVFALIAIFAVRGSLSFGWSIVPALAFAVLVIVHAMVLQRGEHARRAARFYERGVARVQGKWAGQGRDGARFLDSHPYVRDLDLFGRGSLFELVNSARTEVGEETLAGWLRAGAPIDEVRARQAAVDELRPMLDFREEAIVRALVSLGAIGLVTTHDLALTELVPTLGPVAANVHFEDRIEDGRMVFDYRMRPGVVERSNALALMRAVGLDV